MVVFEHGKHDYTIYLENDTYDLGKMSISDFEKLMRCNVCGKKYEKPDEHGFEIENGVISWTKHNESKTKIQGVK